MRCLNWRTNVRNKPFEGLAGTGALSAALLLTMPSQAAGHLTAEQVRAAVSNMPTNKVDLSNKDMSGDDLTGLDLSGANLTHADLSGADLHGVKLVGADLTEADLTKADLTGTWIMKANFNRAKLHGATLQVVITSEAMDNQPETAASFVGADLSDTFATVHFSYDDMRGANFTDAGLGHITFEFAKLNDANFRGADLTRADFTGADLTNADFTGAKLDHTTFEQATLRGVTGLAEAGGPK